MTIYPPTSTFELSDWLSFFSYYNLINIKKPVFLKYFVESMRRR